MTELKIPRIIHRMRLGNDALPQEAARFAASWQEHHPNWEIKQWTLETLPSLHNQAAFDACANTGYRSDILRYELLYRYGGVYVDLDFECRRPLDNLLGEITAFAGGIAPRYRDLGEQFLETAILGSVAGHPFFHRLVHDLPNWLDWWGWHPSVAVRTGPQYFQKQFQRWAVQHKSPPVTLFRPDLFYPYLWDEPNHRHASHSASYAVHHWWGSWRRDPATAMAPLERARQRAAGTR